MVTHEYAYFKAPLDEADGSGADGAGVRVLGADAATVRSFADSSAGVLAERTGSGSGANMGSGVWAST